METSPTRVHPTMNFTLAAFRVFLLWRQKNLQSIVRPSLRCHLSLGENLELCTYTLCTVLLIGSLALNGPTASWFDPTGVQISPKPW